MGSRANFEIKSVFNDYKDMLFKSKKYWLIYLVLILILGISTMKNTNILDQSFVMLTFAVVAVLGIFSIVFYMLHDSDEEFYKVAFIIILIFGITTALILPICDVSDEIEHLARAEITSQGVIIPHWTGEDMGVEGLYNHTEGERISSEKNVGAGYNSIRAYNFFSGSLGKTVFQTSYDTAKIDTTPFIIDSAFEQNPFFGYLPQAIGIFLAKLLDLNVIWILWLARICNLIFYAGVVSLAIKKTPALKLPLLAVACIPISMYQASSASIDCMIIGLSILSISYFIYMCRSPDRSLTIKNIAVFSVICLMLGLCKLPYLAFVILLIFVPSKKFEKDKKHNLPILLISIAVVAVIGVLWSRYSAPTLLHSWRSSHNLINSTLQMNYVMHHPSSISKFIYNIIFLEIPNMLTGVFSFFGAHQFHHYADRYHFVTAALLIYLAFVLLAYPRNVKFELKTKLGSIFTIIVIYVGICFIQLLTWASVGYYNLGISTRYFIPLFCLFPIAIWIKQIQLDKDKFDKYAMVFMIAFMATLIISFASKYYWLI
ncbi:MAG: DUF2142 domain-containing protein [Methanobrevibacter sp.]|uniref:DUF2142 domain-containing protein n=1 Tax=Methanobrevibacter sp. TaxID=66852 RepID=UPI001B2C92AA|nr:DUF2142 domain-containing protein [Methanobrevibacter sp.]MBO5151269.1 DUF2142 domain-containing protein [Methanobrevibacter sp.]